MPYVIEFFTDGQPRLSPHQAVSLLIACCIYGSVQ